MDSDRDANQSSQDDPAVESDADRHEREARFDVPTAPTFPSPPDINFQRPSLGRGAPGRAFSRDDPAATMQADQEAGDPRGMSHLGAGLVIGITFPTCVVVGAGIGMWFDHRYNPSGTPWGTVIMTLAGIAAGFMNIFRVVSQMDRRGNKR
jgi:F0F1-type ATP synthase assembly protein I